MAVFTLTIDRRTASFGESQAAERQRIVQALYDAAQIIGSHRDPQPLMLGGVEIGSYAFGVDSVNS